jgi:hypothetical protein
MYAYMKERSICTLIGTSLIRREKQPYAVSTRYKKYNMYAYMKEGSICTVTDIDTLCSQYNMYAYMKERSICTVIDTSYSQYNICMPIRKRDPSVLLLIRLAVNRGWSSYGPVWFPGH